MNKDPKIFKLYELVGEGIVQISKSLDSPCFWATIESHPLDESQVLITQVSNGTFPAPGIWKYTYTRKLKSVTPHIKSVPSGTNDRRFVHE